MTACASDAERIRLVAHERLRLDRSDIHALRWLRALDHLDQDEAPELAVRVLAGLACTRYEACIGADGAPQVWVIDGVTGQRSPLMEATPAESVELLVPGFVAGIAPDWRLAGVAQWQLGAALIAHACGTGDDRLYHSSGSAELPDYVEHVLHGLGHSAAWQMDRVDVLGDVEACRAVAENPPDVADILARLLRQRAAVRYALPGVDECPRASAYAVLQEAGAGEISLHVAATNEDAEAYRRDCAAEGGFRTSEVVTIPPEIARIPDVYAFIEDLLEARQTMGLADVSGIDALPTPASRGPAA